MYAFRIVVLRVRGRFKVVERVSKASGETIRGAEKTLLGEQFSVPGIQYHRLGGAHIKEPPFPVE